MIELEQLQQLIAVSEYGTISSAADAMHLSQPALTRSLQRLEAELGVSLFDRKCNRVVLNGIGELAVTRARGVLDSVSEMGEELRIYETRLSTLTIGSCGPAPMWDLAAELGERFPEKTIATELGETDALIEGLERGRYRLILTELPVERPEILCRKYNEERLCVALPPEHPLSGRASIRLAELGEESVLSYKDFGVWQRLVDKNPKLHYLVQSDRSTLAELVRASSIPCFSSNLTVFRFRDTVNRVRIPLSDEEAAVTFYLCARESDGELFHQLC